MRIHSHSPVILILSILMGKVTTHTAYPQGIHYSHCTLHTATTITQQFLKQKFFTDRMPLLAPNQQQTATMADM